MSRRTPQELWSGAFGDDYIERNSGKDLEAASLRLLAAVLASETVVSVLELGANIGNNLTAISRLFPQATLSAVEINAKACTRLRASGVSVYEGSIFDVTVAETFDLVITSGLLIHIAPADLAKAYELINHTAARLVLLAEYYSPTPLEVPYRGNDGAMWKRDFAGEFLDAYPGFRLKQVGATYHRQFPGCDDTTWFLLERK